MTTPLNILKNNGIYYSDEEYSLIPKIIPKKRGRKVVIRAALDKAFKIRTKHIGQIIIDMVIEAEILDEFNILFRTNIRKADKKHEIAINLMKDLDKALPPMYIHKSWFSISFTHTIDKNRSEYYILRNKILSSLSFLEYCADMNNKIYKNITLCGHKLHPCVQKEYIDRIFKDLPSINTKLEKIDEKINTNIDIIEKAYKQFTEYCRDQSNILEVIQTDLLNAATKILYQKEDVSNIVSESDVKILQFKTAQ